MLGTICSTNDFKLLGRLEKSLSVNGTAHQKGRGMWMFLANTFMDQCGDLISADMFEQIAKTCTKKGDDACSIAYQVVASAAASLKLDRVVQVAEKFNLRELLQRGQRQHRLVAERSDGGETKWGGAGSSDEDDEYDEPRGLVTQTMFALTIAGRAWDHSTSMIIRLLYDLGADLTSPSASVALLTAITNTRGTSSAAAECFVHLKAPLRRTMFGLSYYLREMIDQFIEPVDSKVDMDDEGKEWKVLALERMHETELVDGLRTLASLISTVDSMRDLALSNGETSLHISSHAATIVERFGASQLPSPPFQCYHSNGLIWFPVLVLLHPCFSTIGRSSVVIVLSRVEVRQ